MKIDEIYEEHTEVDTMLKFAFLVNVEGATPETYSAVYENEESYSVIAGVDGMEAGREHLKKLVADGFALINLCGDFDDEITAKMLADAGEGIRISHSDYSPENLAKLNALESFKDYGIIVRMDGVDEPVTVSAENESCVTTAVFVNDMQQAKAAAKALVDSGKAGFIELCSWFDRKMTEEVSSFIDGAVPIGTCGYNK